MEPSTGPNNVALPPMATPTRKPIEATTPTSAGEIMPATGTNSAPPIDAKTAAMTKATILMTAGLYPRNLTRFYSSRTATRSSPKRLRMSWRTISTMATSVPAAT